jgi:hypothetical protein
MAKVVDCCVWCWKKCIRPEGFDPATKFLVCSPECAKQETNFRIFFSDKLIGERNMKDYGVNPNHRGRK